MADKRTNKGRRKEAPSGETSAERFARRYPSGAPFGKPSEGFMGRHTFVTLALALLAALTITTSLAIMFPEREAPGAFAFPCTEDEALLDTGECVDGRAGSSVGGTLVPDDLRCEEDEIIGFVAGPVVPFPLGCVHVDTFCPAGQHVGASDACEPDVRGSTDATPTLPAATPCGPQTYVGCGERPTPRPERGDTTLPNANQNSPGTEGMEDADGCNPPNTWAGSERDGFRCVPLSELEAQGGRTGHIATPNGRINYHTGTCSDNETRLDPPFADVPLCIRTVDVPLLP